MCWNQAVSLNTFIFSTFVLLLIIYNNKYTQYKIKELDNFWIYAFLFSFISMQLIEYFIWRNYNNKFYNCLFTWCVLLLLLWQPVCSMLIISNKYLRNHLLLLYLILLVPFFIYKLIYKPKVYSLIEKNGHLSWHFFDINLLITSIWLFFFLFSLFYEKFWGGFLFGVITFFITFYNYYFENTGESMWCWIVNSIFIYYAAYLLLFLPYLEKTGNLK